MLIVAGLSPILGLGQPAPKLELADGSVVVSGLDKISSALLQQGNWSDEEWTAAFPIYTWHAYTKGIRQPIAGHYMLEGTGLVFTPLFPFSEGESYQAVLNCEILLKKSGEGAVKNQKQVELTFTIPRVHFEQTAIQAVYPSADTLPENILRMYIYFSSPMTTGESYDHIHLIDANGHAVEKPFLVVDQELWDSDRRRFTLLFDPGRIKRGIQSNLDLGLPLARNHSYRMVIDSLWRDERGNTLAHSYEKKIVVKDPDRTILNSSTWKITPPDAGSKDPLMVQFENPLDHVLTLKYIAVTDVLTGPLEGEASLIQGDKVWTFTPRKPWSSGSYTLTVSPYLEDPAGNNFNNPFDVDLSESERVNSGEVITVEFIVKETLN